MDKKELFLYELSELSKRYGIYIDGCGCCNSPYLIECEPDWQNGELQWDNEKKEYTLI